MRAEKACPTCGGEVIVFLDQDDPRHVWIYAVVKKCHCPIKAVLDAEVVLEPICPGCGGKGERSLEAWPGEAARVVQCEECLGEGVLEA